MNVSAFKLNFYTEVLDLSYLLSELDERVCSKRFIKLNHALTGLVEDYNLVSFYPLNVQVITDAYCSFTFSCSFRSTL